MTDFILVFSTCGAQEEARRIARELVARRLAACVNILSPVESVYRWKGAVEEASEWLLAIKTRRALFDPLAAAIKELHSYEVPEIVALPLVAGASSYLDWIAAETQES